MDKQKRQYPSQAQKTRLAQLLEADPQLRSGKFSCNFTKKVASERWEKIAVEVNSITGANKSGKDWRNTWIDMRAYVKKKNAGQKRSIRKTGGGPPDDPMTCSDEIILGTISDEALVGHSDSQESAATLINFHPPVIELEDIIIMDDCETQLDPFLETEPQSASNQGTEPTGTEPNPSTSLASNHETEPTETEPKESTSMASSQAPSHAKRTKRTVAQKRLQSSLDAAQALHFNLKEKNKIKKEFYNGYLQEMRRQTDAMGRQADAILEIARSIEAKSLYYMDSYSS